MALEHTGYTALQTPYPVILILAGLTFDSPRMPPSTNPAVEARAGQRFPHLSYPSVRD